MYDLAIVGLGPSGIEAANIAVKNGLKTIVFEKNEIGGTCLNVGCIPTKAILHTSSMFREINSLSKLGISFEGEAKVDWHEVLNRKTEIVSKFTKLLNMSFAKKLTLVKQEAKISIQKDFVELVCKDETYKTKKLIIATGSVPFELPNLKFDGDFILNSDDLYNLDELPKRIAIVGSGAIGLEWAKIFSDFGSEVFVIEKAQNLAPNLDTEVSKRIERILKTNKIQYFKDDFIVEANKNEITLNSGTKIQADKVLVAVGRKPVLPQILDFEGVLNIADDCKTQFENIFVVGDAIGKLMLAHNASYQANQVMNYILNNKEFEEKNVPAVIYINPEIACVGLREQDVLGDDSYKIKKLMITSIAKAWCDDKADGFIKLIIKDNLIVGAHVVSHEACSLITILNILIDKKIPLDEIEQMIFPHPSFAEAILEVVKNG